MTRWASATIRPQSLGLGGTAPRRRAAAILSALSIVILIPFNGRPTTAASDDLQDRSGRLTTLTLGETSSRAVGLQSLPLRLSPRRDAKRSPFRGPELAVGGLAQSRPGIAPRSRA